MKVIIIGGGRVGSHLASLLIKDGYQVKVVENREKHLKALYQDLPAEIIIKGGFTDTAVLEAAGIRDADVAVAVTNTDEGNLVVSTLAHYEYGVKRVIARANNPKNTWLFTKEMGVDVALTEADLMAHVVAEQMSLGDVMTLLKLKKGEYSLVQNKVHPQSHVVDKALRELHLPRECVLTAIIRKDELIIPRGDTVLHANDEILGLSHVSHLQTLRQILGPEESA
ncbi:MAG TPA: TrkA family potassium uptake protein [Clostridia bacterium]|nr:TrkA family potassium uptake protein [Clostridia bacterium]